MTEKIILLFSAMSDRRTPWYAKAMVGLVLAYILSPIDIIPDIIPVIGFLDELILVPIALAFIFKFIPDSVKQEKLSLDINEPRKKKLMLIGMVLVLFVWLSFIGLVVFFLI